jgi:hypothetical protein
MRTPFLFSPSRVLAGALLLTLAGVAAAEPPTRAARLGYADGTVSFVPAGQPDWVRASLNRPLTTGDRLWSGSDSRAELQIGGAAVRLGPRTSVNILNLTTASPSSRSRRARSRSGFATSLRPELRDRDAEPGADGAPARRVPDRRRCRGRLDRRGRAKRRPAEVYGQGSAYALDTRRGYRFYGADLNDYDVLNARRDDDIDRWSRDRDRRGEKSASARYVSADVVGYESSTLAAAGASSPATGRCGRRTGSRPAGPRIATATGPGSTPGAGPGWTTRRGATRSLTTVAGPT